jgi:phosphogluconate dehydratase
MGAIAAPLHDRVREVTERIRSRSAPSRATYLARMTAATASGVARERLACTNLAHGLAAAETSDKEGLWPNRRALTSRRPIVETPSLS